MGVSSISQLFVEIAFTVGYCRVTVEMPAQMLKAMCRVAGHQYFQAICLATW